MNIDGNDDNHGMSNNPLETEPLLETAVHEPSPTSTKKILVASSSMKPMEKKLNVLPFVEVMYVDLTTKQDNESIANTNPPSIVDDI